MGLNLLTSKARGLSISKHFICRHVKRCQLHTFEVSLFLFHALKLCKLGHVTTVGWKSLFLKRQHFFMCPHFFFAGCIMLRPFNISLLCVAFFRYLKATATVLFRTTLTKKIMLHPLKTYEMTPWLKPFNKKTVSKIREYLLLDVRTWPFSLAHNIRSF